MRILDYIAPNYIMLMELLGLFILLRSSIHVSGRRAAFTRAALLLILLSSVLIHLELLTQQYETLSPWRPFLTACVYTLQPVIVMMILWLTTPTEKKQLWLLIPQLAAVPLYFTSQRTGLVFHFSEDNHYGGGPLAWLPYMIFAFYGFVFFIHLFLNNRHTRLWDKLSVLFAPAAGVVGGAVYILTGYSDDYSALYAIAIVLYYLAVHMQLVKMDALTGLMNRQCFYRDMNAERARISAVASVDMNELKWINDTLGHDAGDKALTAISDCLRLHGGGKKLVYRVGGDEFVILYLGRDEAAVSEDIRQMREKLAETPYVCAFGYAMVGPDKDPEQALKASDAAMYEDKARLKRETVARGGVLHDRHAVPAPADGQAEGDPV